MIYSLSREFVQEDKWNQGSSSVWMKCDESTSILNVIFKQQVVFSRHNRFTCFLFWTCLITICEK